MELHALGSKWDDMIESRVRLETKRLEKEVREVVRGEILKVINGKIDVISPNAILNSIGLSLRQAETVDRARARLIAEGKLKGNALKKDLDKLRVKLIRERANLIAEHETRIAHAIGQRAAWERLLAEKKLKGGARHWHKLWVASDDERTCAVCMELDGKELPLSEMFEADGEYFGPPEPHPRCRCSLVLVEVRPGWTRELDAEFDAELEMLEAEIEEDEDDDFESDEQLALLLDTEEFKSRADPRMPDIFNPAVGGAMPTKIRRKGLGSLKPGLHRPRNTRLPPGPGDKHPGRVDLPRYRADEDAEGHWVQIRGHPVFIRGPRLARAPRAQAPVARAGQQSAVGPLAPVVGNTPPAPPLRDNPHALPQPIGFFNQPPPPLTPSQEALANVALAKMKANGEHGVNGSYIVTFADGTKGLLKPENLEGAAVGFNIGVKRGVMGQWRNEIVAPQIMRMVGLDHMALDVVETNVRMVPDAKNPGAFLDGKGRGAMQRWYNDADPAESVPAPWDGKDDQLNLAVMDYVLGNGDRHPGNWLVKQSNGRIMANDNGLMLSEKYKFSGFNIAPITRASSRHPNESVRPYVSRWIKNRKQVVSLLRSKGYSEKSIRGFRLRLAEVSRMKTFGEMDRKATRMPWDTPWAALK